MYNFFKNRPKENDTKLIKDSINKRAPIEDDDLEEGEEIVSKNEKFIHRYMDRCFSFSSFCSPK